MIVDTIEVDVAYAIKQLVLGLSCVKYPVGNDCMRRALDALERVQGAIDTEKLGDTLLLNPVDIPMIVEKD